MSDIDPMERTDSVLPPEELLLTVAATLTQEETDNMVSNTELAELIDVRLQPGDDPTI